MTQTHTHRNAQVSRPILPRSSSAGVKFKEKLRFKFPTATLRDTSQKDDLAMHQNPVCTCSMSKIFANNVETV